MSDFKATVPFAKTPGRRFVAALLVDYSILALVVVGTTVLAIVEPAFLTVRNMRNLLDQNAGIGIIACSMTFVIIAGGFDLSVSATFAVSGIVAAMVAVTFDPVLGIFAGILVGIILGVCNGILIARLRVNSFLTTLASSIVIRGIGIALSGGFLINVTNPAFSVLGRGSIYSVTYSGLIFVGFTLFCVLILHQSQFGRYVYSVGGNEEAARLSGIRVGLIKGATFAFAGLGAGLAGVIATSKVSTGIPNSGTGLELQAIAAVVLGGTSIAGGSGAIWRTIVGVFLLAIINNGFNIMNLEPYLRDMVTGSIIIVSVVANTLTGKK